ncbi:MAG: aldo/keto reductase [Spirochaetales bacterium]|nr:aldo/keto reductase [Spirochaetales bacterium]
MEFYLGTWQVSPSDGFWTDQDISESEKVISQAVRMGIRGFDTAHSYGKGRSEQTLAKVLRRFSTPATPITPTKPTTPTKPITPIKTFQIDTKVMPSTKSVQEILDVSRSRLSPYGIDCLYLHWPRSGFDHAAFLRQMEDLKAQGLIGKVGICNMPLGDLKGVVASGISVDRIQIPISLLWTRDLAETRAFCGENNIQIAAYSPTGMGLLSGKYKESADLHDSRAGMFCFKDSCHRQYLELLELLKEISEAHKTSCTKVALAWTASQEPDIILIGARNTAQLKQNLSGSVSLTETELSDLSAAAQKLDEKSRKICSNFFSYDF